MQQDYVDDLKWEARRQIIDGDFSRESLVESATETLVELVGDSLVYTRDIVDRWMSYDCPEPECPIGDFDGLLAAISAAVHEAEVDNCAYQTYDAVDAAARDIADDLPDFFTEGQNLDLLDGEELLELIGEAADYARVEHGESLEDILGK